MLVQTVGGLTVTVGLFVEAQHDPRLCQGLVKLLRALLVCYNCTPDFLRRSLNFGATFAHLRMEKPTIRVIVQRNRLYKYSRLVSSTPHMQHMSKNRALVARRTFLKIATNLGLTNLGEQILSEN